MQMAVEVTGPRERAREPQGGCEGKTSSFGTEGDRGQASGGAWREKSHPLGFCVQQKSPSEGKGSDDGQARSQGQPVASRRASRVLHEKENDMKVREGTDEAKTSSFIFSVLMDLLQDFVQSVSSDPELSLA